jgi:hypothetical protein
MMLRLRRVVAAATAAAPRCLPDGGGTFALRASAGCGGSGFGNGPVARRHNDMKELYYAGRLPRQWAADIDAGLAARLVDVDVDTRPVQHFRWAPWHALLREFEREHGRIPGVVEQWRGKKLGMWCNDQRQGCREQSAACAELLETVPHWYWDAFDCRTQPFDDWVKLLKAFVAERGLLPHADEYEDADGNVWGLRMWCRDRRMDYKAGTSRQCPAGGGGFICQRNREK